MSAAFKTALSSTHKFVFVALCDNANDQGECFPSVSMLAEKTSLSDRAVQKSITYLCESGFLSRNIRNGRSTYYTVTPPHIWAIPPNVVHPRITFTPNDVHPTPERGSPPPPNVVHPTPERGSPITIKEPSVESSIEPSKARRAKSEPAGIDVFAGIDEQVVSDFKKLRVAKKAAITETAIRGIQREAELAGVTLEGALRICCERGWAGFKAEWVNRRATDGRALPMPDKFHVAHLDHSSTTEAARKSMARHNITLPDGDVSFD